MRTKLIAVVGAIAIAFLLATNPVVADAAKQITGKNIKNNSVTTKDIKNNNLTGKDIKESTLSNYNKTYRFRLSTGSPATSKLFTFSGLPASSYLVNYSAAMTTTGSVLCRVYPDKDNLTQPEAASFAFPSGSSATSTSSAVVKVAPGKTPALWCVGSSFEIYGGADQLSQASFTRLDSVVNKGTSGVLRAAKQTSGRFAN